MRRILFYHSNMILIKKFNYVSVSGAFYGYFDEWNGVCITSTLLFLLHTLMDVS